MHQQWERWVEPIHAWSISPSICLTPRSNLAHEAVKWRTVTEIGAVKMEWNCSPGELKEERTKRNECWSALRMGLRIVSFGGEVTEEREGGYSGPAWYMNERKYRINYSHSPFLIQGKWTKMGWTPKAGFEKGNNYTWDTERAALASLAFSLPWKWRGTQFETFIVLVAFRVKVTLKG